MYKSRKLPVSNSTEESTIKKKQCFEYITHKQTGNSYTTTHNQQQSEVLESPYFSSDSVFL